MSFDTSWDVDNYRTEYEYEEHWQFRRQFLVAHKEKFPEDRLVCLAQVFFNVEFLGCNYPKKTMDLIESLSEGLADELREKRKGKLQRTFVAASDAAEAKAKRLYRVQMSLLPGVRSVLIMALLLTIILTIYTRVGSQFKFFIMSDCSRPNKLLHWTNLQ